MLYLIDVGNSYVKVFSYLKGQGLSSLTSFETAASENWYRHLSNISLDGNVMLSTVVPLPNHVLSYLQTKARGIYPISQLNQLGVDDTAYLPSGLGQDRRCLACGALFTKPARASLVIGLGTCITYTIVSAEGLYLDGAITPGLHMRLDSMHTDTAMLPSVNLPSELHLAEPSFDTMHAMQKGAVLGAIAEIQGLSERFLLAHDIENVWISGGHSSYLQPYLDRNYLYVPELAFQGMVYLAHINDII